ncbi:MAG TPA: hypothetical protein VFE27_03495 [Acidobacteriaceae bacterium]|jgi:hypothetical protein|nr:hypothetical protein [Acidobacteriaceae bacterium]
MKGHYQALAFATAVLALPLFAYSQNATTQNFTQADQHEAALMKPANAVLVTNLDGVKDRSGSAVSAKLQGKVNLSNGTELPGGTMLLGQITDDTQQQGTRKLALRFDQARLKNGTTVPIRATIVGFYPSTAGDTNSGVVPANDWTASTLEFDQTGVTSGVDLHSQIGSQNSGVFVSTKKDNVKLRQGSQIQFAIAPANSSQSGMSAGGQS